jgi:hypothetical protein
VSTPRDSERRFLGTITGWLLSLPHDLKVLFEAKDDPNLDRTARETAAGAILYVLNPDKVSGEEPFVGFADDAVLVRAALAKIADQGGEGADPFRTRFEEYYATLAQDLDLCREVMGEVYSWLDGKIDGLAKQSYKGMKVAQYIDDDETAEELYEDGLAFATDYPLDEDKLGMRLKRTETLLEPLRKKAQEEKKKIAAAL